ncbi:hypothetical protein [Lactiplantibacillus pentosus]|jgi:hypothetical protein|uniref:hypothetical protein n=1 Tax=Lactiplantibacillus pentosus TaxID=1589 RepID=UPI0021822091|nr:hypothetical protein [Lactiplantibacillus pentosus]MCH4056401.1 hypothetical protein [Lactobacillaceae bacterium]MCT0162041.1 hypothetical protein [Lactiplantibacillus pentosus]
MTTYQQAVAQISNLNSVSTLKRWKQQAEELVPYQFTQTRIRTGRHSYQIVPEFSADEIAKFQQVANTKAELGLKPAILKAFGTGKSEQENLKEQLTDLTERLAEAERFNRGLRSYFNSEINQLKSRIDDLEQSRISLFKRKRDR